MMSSLVPSIGPFKGEDNKGRTTKAVNALPYPCNSSATVEGGG